MGTSAAVLTSVDQPLRLRHDVEVETPHAGEVRIRVAACGVCRSDLSMQDGQRFDGVEVVSPFRDASAGGQ